MKAVILIVVAFSLFAGPAAAQTAPADVLKAVVEIRAKIPARSPSADSLGSERQGSGVLISARGYILTIGYLIRDAEQIEVTFSDGKRAPAVYVGYDFETGFGLARLEQPIKTPPLVLGRSSEVKQGDRLVIASSGGTQSVQPTRVVSRGEFAGYWEYVIDDAIYVSPPHPNFGGAALVGRDGELLGIGSIYTQLAAPGVGSLPANMFVPIDLLKPILDQLISRGQAARPAKPWLGLNAQDSYGHIIVTSITLGGPAAAGGLERGDIVLMVNGGKIEGLGDFFRKVWASGPAGAEVKLTVLQGTQIRELLIRSGNRNDRPAPQPAERKDVVLLN